MRNDYENKVLSSVHFNIPLFAQLDQDSISKLKVNYYYMYTVSSSSCLVYPSEYAYQDNSVTRSESINVNRRNYPAQGEDHSEYYIHCDGQQLKLTDSNLGQEQYQSSNYYWWIDGSDDQLLFIFPTTVSLTAITLHYYSTSDSG